MGGSFLILKLSFLSLVLASQLFSIEVLVSKEAIKFEEKIDASKVETKEVSNLSRACVPVKLEELESTTYITTHHINKNAVICEKDIKKLGDTGVVFNFGGVQIVKQGKIIYENDEFIRFKNLDGTIEQIYKDGRLK